MYTKSEKNLLESTYVEILTEQQRIIEEGKIWDFIKSMGGKLKNAWDVINTKIVTNPKLYKGLMIAGPILASLAAKNFDNLQVSSETVKDLLNTLNGLDPNITSEDLTKLLSDWDHNHSASFGNVNTDGNDYTATDLNVGDNKDGTYSFSGTTVKGNTGFDKDLGVSQEVHVQSHNSASETLETITQNGELKTFIKNLSFEAIKTTNTDGSGSEFLVEYSGTITASSPEEAMKIMSELIKKGIEASKIDFKIEKLTPNAELLQNDNLRDSYYHRVDQSTYLMELASFGKMKDSITGAAGAAVNKIKNLVIGAKNIVSRIKSSFKKSPNTPEKSYRVNLKVSLVPAK